MSSNNSWINNKKEMSDISNYHRFIIVLLLTSLSVSVCLFSSSLGHSASLDSVSNELVKKLNKQYKLKGLDIQLSPASFTEQSTTRQHSISSSLYEKVTVALIQSGANVSLHETGREPIRLVGTYLELDKYLEIHFRLRKMGRLESQDVAVANYKIKLSNIDQILLQVNLDVLATELIRKVEKNYIDVDGSKLIVEQPKPFITGKPTLKLGSALKSALERALLDSDTFGGVMVGATNKQIRFVSKYNVSDNVQVVVTLEGENFMPLASASSIIAKGSLPPHYFEMIKDQGAGICIGYSPKSKKAISPDSPTVEILLEQLSSALNSIGIEPDGCHFSNAPIVVASSLNMSRKKTPDGYKLLLGDLHLTVTNNNKKIGSVRSKAHQSGATIDDATSALVEKIFTPELKKQLAELVLGVQPE